MSAGREVEIKLPASSVAEARRMLRNAGFRVSKRRVFERNVIYDNASRELRNNRKLLRLRTAGADVIVTFKGPPVPGKHKSREELEVGADNARGMSVIFERLGFTPVFRYEKYRTEFRRAGSSGVATIDETPAGVYLELEGPPTWIDRAARTLGFDEGDYLTVSYANLWMNWRNGHPGCPEDMVFG